MKAEHRHPQHHGDLATGQERETHSASVGDFASREEAADR